MKTNINIKLPHKQWLQWKGNSPSQEMDVYINELDRNLRAQTAVEAANFLTHTQNMLDRLFPIKFHQYPSVSLLSWLTREPVAETHFYVGQQTFKTSKTKDNLRRKMEQCRAAGGVVRRGRSKCRQFGVGGEKCQE